MKRKWILTVLGLFLTAAVSAMGTLAYLTDTDAAVNTFTVGKVNISLDEADVDEEGNLILDEDGNPVERVKGNEYHLVPGQTYIKDPTVTVAADSESAYVRMMVTVNCLAELNEIFAPDGAELTEIFGEYAPETWIYAGKSTDEEENTITYEFRYLEKVEGSETDEELPALFKTITVPGTITMEELKTLQDLTITVTGHAIQAAGFADEDAAWAAFEEQITD